ncbi:MAG: hypothetical protein WC071_07670 [Victivallaceae bacterium]
MKKTGIWIDHQEAVIVSLENRQATVTRINSNADSHYHPSGGCKSSGSLVAQAVSKEKTADNRLKHQLHLFYINVINTVNNDDNIFIFGPGEAKQEFLKEIENKKTVLFSKIVEIETCDRITENQIVAKVKFFYRNVMSPHLN